MKYIIGLLALTPLFIVLHITSIIARSMAVISAIAAAAIVHVIFWTNSPTLMSWADRHFGTTEMKEQK
jgi:hypothetical protein